MQAAMTLNVQGAAATPWPDPVTQAALAPQQQQHPWPTAPPPVHAERHEVRKVEAPAASNAYDAMRMQAYRRDVAETVALGSQAAPATATASTASAPAVKVAPAPQVNPLAAQPEPPVRPVVAPAPAPAIQAPSAIDQQAGARGG